MKRMREKEEWNRKLKIEKEKKGRTGNKHRKG